MENNKKITIIKRISASLCLVAFCFVLFGSLFIPIRKANAEQSYGGDGSLIVESNDFYRAFMPFDTLAIYDGISNTTTQGGYDFGYYDKSIHLVTTTSPTIPSTGITWFFNSTWNYSAFYNYAFFDTSTSYYSDFNVQCVDAWYMLGGLAYETDLSVDISIPHLGFALSEPILVDHTAGDTTFSIVSSSYDATAFCLNWNARITYTLIYIDNNGEQQTINVAISQSEPFAIEVGQVYNIMPALPANADLNYPYLLYKYHLTLTPFSPNGALTVLTETYAIPLFRFDSYAYKTTDYRFLEYEFYDTNITIIDPVDNWVEAIKSFFFDSIHGFLSTEILPGITFYWILFVCVGVPILIAILKIWLGG